jgi:twitching motility protein PilT
MLPKLDVHGRGPAATADFHFGRLELTACRGHRRIPDEVLEKKGSDLHFIAGDPPRIRQYGDLMPLRPDKLAAEFVKSGALRDHAQAGTRSLRAKDGADFAYTFAERGRFRVNVMRQLNGMGAVFRVIPSKALQPG